MRTTAAVSVKPEAKDQKEKPKVTLQSAYDSGRGRVIDTEVLVSASQAQVADEQAIQALEAARVALIEISNTNTIGWDATKPIESYKVLITHMADRAREASEEVSAAIRQLKS